MKPVQKESDSSVLHGSDRITRIGRLLRKFSLDELPQLWNILTGDMNIIGPRPLPVEYLERMDPEIKKRHIVYPGITGWAQVNGRNSISWQDKFSMDQWYIDHRTLKLDLKILIRTIAQLADPKGILQDESQIMEEYKGIEK
jgi:sugar transferase EpsL